MEFNEDYDRQQSEGLSKLFSRVRATGGETTCRYDGKSLPDYKSGSSYSTPEGRFGARSNCDSIYNYTRSTQPDSRCQQQQEDK